VKPGASLSRVAVAAFAITVFARALGGCVPGAYTNVRAMGDGSFLMTRVSSGAFGTTNAVLLRCRFMQQVLQCAEVGTP
jgi:hypothetical protein